MKEINISDKETSKVEVKKEVSSNTAPTTTSPVKEQPSLKKPIEITKEDSTTKKVQESTKPLANISKKKSILIISAIALVLVLGLASFYYFGIYRYNPNPPEDNIVDVSGNYINSKLLSKVFGNTLIDAPQEPRTEVSPLNGLLFTKSEMDDLRDKRPIAVMVNNHAAARPQSGLNSADIVYEALVESGITRYMAIFWSQAPAKVGPVRSARQYYLEWLSPYDALYIHDGCGSSDDPRVDACGNIYLYSIKDVATVGSWRWNDGTRYAPHNEYNSLLTAWEYAEDRGWDGFPTNFESWKFKNDTPIDERGDGYRYDTIFHKALHNGGYYDTTWEYDPSTNSYNRWVGGRVDIDQETNTQVNAKVVVMQETNLIPTYDKKAHIIIETIGEGDATILIDGKEINGSWKKSTRTDRTTFYDSTGEEIEFNRGRVWISILSKTTSEFDIIDQ